MPRTNPWWKGNGKSRGCDLDAEAPRRGDQRGEAAKSTERTSAETAEDGGLRFEADAVSERRPKTKSMGRDGLAPSVGYTRRKLQLCKRIGVAMAGGGIVMGWWRPGCRRGGRGGWIRWRHCGGSKGVGRRMPHEWGHGNLKGYATGTPPRRHRLRPAGSTGACFPGSRGGRRESIQIGRASWR